MKVNKMIGYIPESARQACDLTEAKRKNAASEMREYSEQLANLAEMLVHKTNEKLGPYYVEYPQECTKDGYAARQFPAYFEELRSNLTRIANALNAVGNIVNNSEL